MAKSKGSYMIWQMRRLIRISNGHTCQKIYFPVTVKRLSYLDRWSQDFDLHITYKQINEENIKAQFL